MATPVPDSYSAASGQAIYGGRLSAALLGGTMVIAGDSITDPGYSSNPFPMMLGLARNSPLVLKNAAIFGTTLQGWIDTHMDAQVIARAPSICAIRLGTNSLGLSAAAFESQYTVLLNKLEAAGIFGLIHAISPIGSSGTGPVARNAFLKAYCDARPTKFFFVDDCLTIGDSSYVPIAAYYATDKIHPNAFGSYMMAKAGHAILAAKFAPVSLLVSSSTDISPTTNQYVGNPFFAGTGGSNSGSTGGMPNGWTCSTPGTAANGTTTTAVSSIVAADAGDPNQRPWLRINLAASAGNNQYVVLSCTLQHPAIAAGDMTRFDIAFEMRYNNLDTTNISRMSMTLQNGGGALIASGGPALAGSGVLNENMIFRQSNERDKTMAINANFMKFAVNFSYSGVFSTSAGSVDIRCPTVRGII